MSMFLLHDTSHQVAVFIENIGTGIAVHTDTVRWRRHVGGRHSDTVTVTETLVDARWQRHTQVTHQCHLSHWQHTTHVGGRHSDTVTVTETLVDARWQRHTQVTHQCHLSHWQHTCSWCFSTVTVTPFGTSWSYSMPGPVSTWMGDHL